MNRNLMHYMYESIDRKYTNTLITRCILMPITLGCIYTSVKYLPISYVSLMTSLAPLLTALLMFIIYRTRLNRIDSLVLLTSFSGVVLIIMATFSTEGPTQEAPPLFPILALMLTPFTIALGPILIAKLNTLSEISVGAYNSLTMAVIFFFVAIFTSGLSYLGDFATLDWLVLILLGFTSSFVQMCIALASQYERPDKTAVLNYFQPVIMLLTDVTLFGTAFSTQQAIGIGMVLGSNFIKWTIAIRNAFLKPKEVK